VEAMRMTTVKKQGQHAKGRFHLAANILPVTIWASDPDQRCTYMSNEWSDFTACSLEQVLAEGWADSLHADDRHSCLATFSDAFDGRKPYRMEYRLRRRDGAFRWVLETGVPRFTEDGRFEGIVGSCLDITERIEAGRALCASEARFRSIAEQTYDWESWIGPHKKPLWINPAVERMTGYSVEECLNMRNYPLPIVHREERQRFVEELKLPSGNDLPFRMVRKDNSLRAAAISWQTIVDDQGQLAGARTSVRESRERVVSHVGAPLVSRFRDGMKGGQKTFSDDERPLA
ncbi:MAG: PAS domain-containing protein, partial [Candidatus Moraniibacteriota bacterium]